MKTYAMNKGLLCLGILFSSHGVSSFAQELPIDGIPALKPGTRSTPVYAGAEEASPQPQEPPPSPGLHVQPGRRLNDQAKLLHANLAGVITKAALAPPWARIQHFSDSGLSTDGIRAWGGIIGSVKAVQGGFVVTVRVTARYDTAAMSSISTIETYLVADDQITLLEAVGERSKLPAMMIGF